MRKLNISRGIEVAIEVAWSIVDEIELGVKVIETSLLAGQG